jgi:hypothetical protein
MIFRIRPQAIVFGFGLLECIIELLVDDLHDPRDAALLAFWKVIEADPLYSRPLSSSRAFRHLDYAQPGVP